MVVGSLGGLAALCQADVRQCRESCEVIEIRLDLLGTAGIAERAWSHLAGLPLLFTARRAEEGGSGALTAAARMAMLRESLDDAACIDIEVASIGEMEPVLAELRARRMPWVASFHDFEKLPENPVLAEAARSSSSPSTASPPPRWAWGRWLRFRGCCARSAAAC